MGRVYKLHLSRIIGCFILATCLHSHAAEIQLKSVTGYWSSANTAPVDASQKKLTLMSRSKKKSPEVDVATLVYYVKVKHKTRSCEFKMVRHLNEPGYVLAYQQNKTRSNIAKLCGSPTKIELKLVDPKNLTATVHHKSDPPSTLHMRAVSPNANVLYVGSLPAKLSVTETPPQIKEIAVVKTKPTVKINNTQPTGFLANSACAEINASSSDSVFRCMQSYKKYNTPNAKSKFFNALPKSSCQSSRAMLKQALMLAGHNEGALEQILPDCAVLAKAAVRLNRRTNWAGCVSYNPRGYGFSSQCLSQLFIASYGPNYRLKVDTLSCLEYTGLYEKAVKSGTKNHTLPNDWRPLKCGQINYLNTLIKKRDKTKIQCGGDNRQSLKENDVYKCLVAANVDVDDLDCPSIKRAYQAVNLSYFGYENAHPFTANCDVLMKIVYTNSKSYLEEKRLANQKKRALEDQRLRAIRAKIEKQDSLYAARVESMPQTLGTLEKLIDDERIRIKKEQDTDHFYDSLVNRKKIRVKLLNKLGAPIIRLIEQQSERDGLISIRKKYELNNDWSVAYADPLIKQAFEDKKDSLGPFKNIAQKDYLNAIYWLDREYIERADKQALAASARATKGIEDTIYGMNYAFLKLVAETGVSIPINSAVEQTDFERKKTLLKSVATTYLVNYQTLYADCLRDNHVVYTYFRPAEDTVIINDGYGGRISRTEGSAEIKRTYRINREFYRLASKLDIDRPSSQQDAQIAESLAGKVFGKQIIQQLVATQKSIRQGVSEMMAKHDCHSPEIKTFEASLLALF